LQSDNEWVNEETKDSIYDEFWLKYIPKKKYQTLIIDLKLCTMFGFPYVSKSAFSKLIISRTNQILAHRQKPRNDNEDSMY